MRNGIGSSSTLSRLQQAGLGLIDVLIALLLLNLSLLGAGAATLRALQAGRAAMLQMRATDLSADLHEDMEGARETDTSVQIADWRLRVAATLPTATASVRPTGGPLLADVLAVHLQWKEPADAALDLSMPLRPQARGFEP